ncbi:MAG: hypothetical protein LBM75_05850 [Myxococcales bacterium]|nr:hypothetical protein [Myxococcales bacterium]
MTRKITFWMMSGLFASLFALVACQQQKRDELRQELDASFSQPDANANPGEALIDAGQPDALGVDASFGMDASEALDAGPQAPTIFNPMDAGDF